MEIPSSVSDLDMQYLFSGCESLEDLKIFSQKGTNVSGGTFDGCTALKSVYWNLSEIPQNTFIDCISLSDLTIGGGCTSIGDAFNSDVKLNLTIEDGDELTMRYTGMVVSLNYNRTSIGYRNSGTVYDTKFNNLQRLIIGENITDCTVNIGSTKDITYLESRALTPPKMPSFEEIQYIDLVPIVPAESLELYKQAPVWKEFWNLTAGVEDAIDDEAEKRIIGTYDINGRTVSDEYKGIVIQRYSDGTARKLIRQ